MKHTAKLLHHDTWATGYYFQAEHRHFLILDDVELKDSDLSSGKVIDDFVEIDAGALRPVQTFGTMIAAKRKQLGLSQEKLAHQIGISRNYLSLLERDKARNLSVVIFIRLADSLGIDGGELVKAWEGQ